VSHRYERKSSWCSSPKPERDLGAALLYHEHPVPTSPTTSASRETSKPLSCHEYGLRCVHYYMLLFRRTLGRSLPKEGLERARGSAGA
jgi:hypothetical protein